MVPMESLALEEHRGEDGEDDEGDGLLNDLELHQGERTTILMEANAVGRYLATVLEKGKTPTQQDDGKQGPGGGNLHLLQLQMTVPGEGHEDVRNY